MMLVGRPGLGKTPPKGFIYKPLRDLDDARLIEYCEAMMNAHFNNPRGVSVVDDEILGRLSSG